MTFIVICGTDGSGKETQVQLLKQRLEQQGKKVQIADFPRYGKRSANLVEDYLNGKFGTVDEVNSKVGSIFFAVDRYAASFQIKEWLKANNIVISNRYVSANKGHQMSKLPREERDAFLRWLDELEYTIFNIPKENLNILLYVPPDIGQTLVDKKEARSYTDKKRDIHEADISHLEKAAEAYKYVAEKEGWTIINCTKDNQLMSKEEIHEEIYKAIQPILASQHQPL